MNNRRYLVFLAAVGLFAVTSSFVKVRLASAKECLQPSISLNVSVPPGQKVSENNSLRSVHATITKIDITDHNISDVVASGDYGFLLTSTVLVSFKGGFHVPRVHRAGLIDGSSSFEHDDAPMNINGHTERLSPGEKRMYDLELDKIYDLSQPGNYSLSIERLDPENKGCKIRSNTLTFELTE